jgi:23S rRNA pseudouridine1911/1915/1917 synthase
MQSGISLNPIGIQPLIPRSELFEVLHEDEHLLVINKPAGLVCHPTKGDQYSSLISRVRIYLGSDSHPHMVNRLDRETSGVVVVGKTQAAAVMLRRSWESRSVQKEYVAIVHGHPGNDQGLVDAPIGDDPQSEIAIKGAIRPDGAASQTEFLVRKRFFRDNNPFALLHVSPRTGRKHQIRIHLAHIGHPIVGDKLYGGDEQRYLRFVKFAQSEEDLKALILPHHALHATKLSFTFNNDQLSFEAPPEPWFEAFIREDSL